jgi:5-methyltetrahydrofolate--homocysteine methyltransferase
MVHVAKEMDRQGFSVPLLIGGATTSKVHTAVKIAPAYSKPVVHVLDASRAVGAVGSLLSPDLRSSYIADNRRNQADAREKYLGRQSEVPLLTLNDARTRRPSFDWTSNGRPAVPEFTGLKVLREVPLSDLVPYIDWTPFFHTWELKGSYPRILQDPTIGPRAAELFADAQKLLKRIVEQRLLTARAVYGFFRANSVGDDIEVYSEPTRMLHTLRQQTRKAEGESNIALADFIAPKSTGIPDYIGAFAVTAGIGLPQLCEQFEKDHDDYNSIMAKALADRLAEASAEYLHKKVRNDWGYGRIEKLSPDDLIAERYRGIRPAPGYPAQPDHTEKRTIFDLLDAERNADIQLTESFAMMPASSVSGLYFSHPQARYFSVGKIDRDQVEDYSRRKRIDVAEMERWLRPILGYES